MQIELRRIQREVGITTIFVTHDQEEALTLSDRIGILKAGRLVQEGTPREVYHAPVDRFTAHFLGEANIFEGQAEAAGLRLADGSLIAWPAGRRPAAHTLQIAVRPEVITVSKEAPAADGKLNGLRGELDHVIFAGAMATCLLRVNGQPVKVLAKDQELTGLPTKGAVWLSWPIERSMAIGGEA
jgi:putative spermidine/putrescine transport system ATP-binding protein